MCMPEEVARRVREVELRILSTEKQYRSKPLKTSAPGSQHFRLIAHGYTDRLGSEGALQYVFHPAASVDHVVV